MRVNVRTRHARQGLRLLGALLLVGSLVVNASPARAAAGAAVDAVGHFAATDSAMDDFVFNWLEKNYSAYFAPAGAASASADGYYYRYYSKTNSYLAEKNGELLYLYAGNLGDVGRVSDWAGKAGYKVTSGTTTGGSTTGSTSSGSSAGTSGGSTSGTGGAGGTNSGSMTAGQALALEYAAALMRIALDDGTHDLGSEQAGTTAGYVLITCNYCTHQHWRLPVAEYTVYGTTLNGYMQAFEAGVDDYLNKQDINGYVAYVQSMAAQYAAKAAQIPAIMSAYWF